MATVTDDIINGFNGASKFPKIRIGAGSLIADPEMPTGVSDRDIGVSQAAYLIRSLSGPKALPPEKNPVWQELMQTAGKIRTQQQSENFSPNLELPDEAARHSGLLLRYGVQKTIVDNQIGALAPNTEVRAGTLRATIDAAVAMRDVNRAVESGIRRGDETIASPEGRALNKASLELAATTTPDVARAVFNAVIDKSSGKDINKRSWDLPGFAEAMSSPQATSLSQAADKFIESEAGKNRDVRFSAIKDAMNGGPTTTLGQAAEKVRANNEPAAAQAILDSAATFNTTGRHPTQETYAIPGFRTGWTSPAAAELRQATTTFDAATKTSMQESTAKDMAQYMKTISFPGMAEALANSDIATQAFRTKESRAVQTAAQELMASKPPEVARAVFAAAITETVERKSPSLKTQEIPGFNEAWASPQGLDLRGTTRRLDATLDNMRQSETLKTLYNLVREEGFSGRQPTREDYAKTPDLKTLWGTEPVKNLRNTAAEIANAASEFTKTENKLMTDAKIEGVPLNARDTYANWLRTAPAPLAKGRERWTEGYEVVMENKGSIQAVTPFIELALRASDRQITPSMEQMNRDVQAIKKELSSPKREIIDGMVTKPIMDSIVDQSGTVIRTKARVPDVPGGNFQTVRDDKGNPIMKPVLDRNTGEPLLDKDGAPRLQPVILPTEIRVPGRQEITTRPSLVGPNPYNGHMTGLEGQSYYSNADAIAGVIRETMKENRPSGNTFVSHPEPGKPFREALIAAAEMTGLRIVQGEMKVTKSTVGVFSEQQMTHVDYNNMSEGSRHYMGEGGAVTVTERNITVPGRNGPVSLDSREGRAATKNALVLIDVDMPHKKRGNELGGDATTAKADSPINYVARFNGGALTAPHVVLFGGVERGEDNIFKIARRREFSDLPPPRMIDKNGIEATPEHIAAVTASHRGQSQTEKRETEVANTRGWATSTTAAQMLVRELVDSRDQQKAILNSYKTIGDAVRAASDYEKTPRGQRPPLPPEGSQERTALYGAFALLRATENTTTYAAAINRIEKRFEKTTDIDPATGQPVKDPSTGKDARVRDILADPREPGVLRAGNMYGFSDGPGRNAAPGSRYAIIGDNAPVTPEMTRRIDVVVSGLATLHGRDENGIAKTRINTTLTPGVGEAVMQAGLKFGVPVEAYSNLDDRNLKGGTKNFELMKLANKLSAENLGGTWSMAPYGDQSHIQGGKDSLTGSVSREKAARVAMDGADVIVASRIAKNDPLLLVVAAAGMDKSIFTLGRSRDQNGSVGEDAQWQGTTQLATAGTRIRAQIPNISSFEPGLIAAGADIKHTSVRNMPGQIKDQSAETNADASPRPPIISRFAIATVDINAPAYNLETVADIKKLKQAASGEIDMSLNRENKGRAAELHGYGRITAAPNLRWDVLDTVDTERFHDKAYRDALKLSPYETKVVNRSITREAFYEEANKHYNPAEEFATGMARRLNERFKVTETAQTRTRARSSAEDMGV
jgi:hypothetical protein